MASTDGYWPRSPASHPIIDQKTDIEAFHKAKGLKRSHTWPFQAVTNELGPSPNTINGAQESWNSPLLAAATSSHFPKAHPFHQEICTSRKSTGLPGLPDIFPETERSTLAATSLYKEAIISQPSFRLESQPCLCLGQETPRLASDSHSSGPTLHPHPHPHRCTSSDDLRREYTLKEALELLPHEPRETGSRFLLDPTRGYITLSSEMAREDRFVSDLDVFEDGTDDNNQHQNRFYAQRLRQSTNLAGPGLLQGGSFKRSACKFISKLGKPLTLLKFKITSRSTGSREQLECGEISQPFDPQHFRGNVVDAQNLKSSDPASQSPLLFSKMSRLERDAPGSVSNNVRRLSVTDSFGPTLAETIEEVILMPPTRSSITPLSTRRRSYQPIPTPLILPFSNHSTNKTVRFHEPEPRQSRSSSDTTISALPPYLTSAYTYRPSRPPRSPPPLPPDHASETHLSLRGGCLPAPRTRRLPPEQWIDPALRPTDNAPVPPVLWYLAGGRPVLKDKGSKACFHCQCKHERKPHFKNWRQGDISHQRSPNAESCEALRFSHLRAWKQRDRPIDRWDPLTGRMERPHRGFRKEFPYGASGGKMAAKRPR